MWNYIDRAVTAEPHFDDLEDDELYKRRPVVEVFENSFR